MLAGKSGIKKWHFALVAATLTALIVVVGAGWVSFAGAASEPLPSGLPEALANYRAPTGSELPLPAVETIVTAETAAARETEPLSATLVKGTFAQLQVAIEPQDQPPSNGAVREWNESSADLVVLRGSFTATQMSVPPGAKPPAGNVMALILDAHTGFVEGRYVGNAVPSLAGLTSPVALAIAPVERADSEAASVPSRYGVLEIHVYAASPAASPGGRAPLDNATLRVSHGGHVIRTIRRAPHGRTSLRFPPGQYSVAGKLEPPDFSSGRTCGKAAAARVKQSHRTTVTIYCSL